MKKFYALMVAFTALSLSARAQVAAPVNETVSDAALINETSYLPSMVIRKAEGDPKAPIGYKKPAGTFYVGLSENYYGYGAYTFLFAPPYTPLDFTAVCGDTISPVWTYVDPTIPYLMTNPKLSSTEKSISLAYQYPTPTRIEMPMLAGSGEHNTDSAFMDASYLNVGHPYMSTATTGRYGMGNHPTGRVYWYNNKYYNSSIFTLNSNYSGVPFQDRWLTQYQNWYGANFTACNVKGLGEYFEKPAQPLTLTGVILNGRTADEIACDMKLTIRDGETRDVLAVLTKTKDEIQPTTTGGAVYNLTFNKMTDAEGNAINELILDKDFYVFYEPQDDVTTFSIYYYRAPYMGDDITMCTLLDYTYSGTEFKDQALDAGGVYTDGTCNKSFCFWLLANYNWLISDVNEYEAPVTGGTATFTVNADAEYLPYGSRVPQWNVTLEDGSELPAWITIEATDAFDTEYNYQGSTEVKLTVAAQQNNAAAREANVMLQWKGAKHIVKVTQEAGPTGINTITTNDDANAPAYNLAGQRVDSNANGVVIRNGKKVIKK